MKSLVMGMINSDSLVSEKLCQILIIYSNHSQPFFQGMIEGLYPGVKFKYSGTGYLKFQRIKI